MCGTCGPQLAEEPGGWKKGNPTSAINKHLSQQFQQLQIAAVDAAVKGQLYSNVGC